MVERDLAKVEVAGSKPVSRSISPSLRSTEYPALWRRLRSSFSLARTFKRPIEEIFEAEPAVVRKG